MNDAQCKVACIKKKKNQQYGVWKVKQKTNIMMTRLAGPAVEEWNYHFHENPSGNGRFVMERLSSGSLHRAAGHACRGEASNFRPLQLSYSIVRSRDISNNAFIIDGKHNYRTTVDIDMKWQWNIIKKQLNFPYYNDFPQCAVLESSRVECTDINFRFLIDFSFAIPLLCRGGKKEDQHIRKDVIVCWKGNEICFLFGQRKQHRR